MDINTFCKEQIGKHVQYTLQRTAKDNERVVTGIVVKCERAYGSILDLRTGKQYPAYKMCIKPDDGSRAIWTTPYPFIE
jgi:hypothetical protein